MDVISTCNGTLAHKDLHIVHRVFYLCFRWRFCGQASLFWVPIYNAIFIVGFFKSCLNLGAKHCQTWRTCLVRSVQQQHCTLLDTYYRVGLCRERPRAELTFTAPVLTSVAAWHSWPGSWHVTQPRTARCCQALHLIVHQDKNKICIKCVKSGLSLLIHCSPYLAISFVTDKTALKHSNVIKILEC